MRLRALLLFLFPLCALAHGDRLVLVPTARKLPFRTVRYELLSQAGSSQVVEHYLGLGIGKSFELELRTQRWASASTVGTFDVGYNFVAPVPDLTPGIAFGVQDAPDTTSDRRRFYFATTFRPTFSTANGDVAADITLGVYAGHQSSAFVGVGIPFSREVRLIAEHNGYRMTVGFEVRPHRSGALRVLVRERATLLGFSLMHRF